jgi:uncharacterized protein YxeA
MKIIIFTILGILMTTTVYAAGTAYYDWSFGTPQPIIDATDTSATTTIQWSFGQPTGVDEFVAEAAAEDEPARQNIIWFD